MHRLRDAYFRVRALLNRGRMRRELDEELAFHLERETAKLVSQGMAPRAARREAHRRFGGVERQREAVRDAWGIRALEDTAADARLAVRRMARSPGFSTLAVVTLGVGIGGTIAMFAMVHAMLVRALPYPDADRLVRISSEAMVTRHNLGDWKAGLRSVDELAAFRFGLDVLTGTSAARNVLFMPVSPEYFSLLGARPALGRLWGPSEDEGAGPPVAVVSHRLWSEELGGAALEGRSLTLGSTSHAVVGVLPADFHNLGYGADVFVPLSSAVGALQLMGQLRPGGDVEALRDEALSLAAALEAPPGSAELGRGVRVERVRDRIVGDVRTPALILLAAAALLLLLACVNVANLLLARAAARSREIAVRSALGAGRSTLVRQLLVESAVLAVAGGALGLGLALQGVRTMVDLAPAAVSRALVGGVALDPAVVAFTAAVVALVTALAGTAPALTVSGAAPGPLRSVGTPGRRRLSDALVATEIALALVLTVGTGLLVRTYLTLRPTSPGFEVEDRFVAEITLPGLRQIRDNLGPPPEDPANAALVRRLVSELERSTPGVRAAAVTAAPLTGAYWTARVVEVDGAPGPREGSIGRDVVFQSATPGYLGVLGMDIVRGRGLAETDVVGAPLVALLNEAAARLLWPGLDDPVGRLVSVDPYGAGRPAADDGEMRAPAGPQLLELRVVGVVRDTRFSPEHTRAEPEIIVSYWQIPWPQVHVVVHGAGAVPSAARTVREAIASLDPTIPVGSGTTLAALVGTSTARPRYEGALMAIFGALALILAVSGCYGVMAHSVTERTRDIGVRIALGATRRRVAGTELAHATVILASGLAAGTVLAAAFTRGLAASLYGVSPTDPGTFAGAAVTVALVTLAAAWLPARRAAAIDPVTTLKQE